MEKTAPRLVSAWDTASLSSQTLIPPQVLKCSEPLRFEESIDALAELRGREVTFSNTVFCLWASAYGAGVVPRKDILNACIRLRFSMVSLVNPIFAHAHIHTHMCTCVCVCVHNMHEIILYSAAEN